jgi:glucose/arabinose dehydrogenase
VHPNRWTRRGVVIGVGVLAAVALTVAAGGAAACKLFLDCGIGSGMKYDEGYLAGLDAGPGVKLPAGFRQEVVARDLTFPTDFAPLPDGRILVGEKHGVVRVVEDGRLLQTPFLDISSRVDNSIYRGLVALHVDPDFETNGYVYLLYTQRGRGSPGSPTSERLLRVTARGDEVLPGSERVLLGSAGAVSCFGLPVGSDCIPSEYDHVGGDIAFAVDGTLFVSTGDGGPDDKRPIQLRAQDPDFLSGKILHVTRDGLGVASNPFWNGDPGANRSKVWALGLRNPFRITLSPASGTPVVADVGQETFEEVDVAPRGANLGWPCYEGRARAPRFGATSVCRSLYAKASAVQLPAVVYRHGAPGGGQSVTGGSFYTGTAFPAGYRGLYFYGDWEKGWLRTLRFDASDRLVHGPDPFASGTAGPVAIRPGRDGALYYLAFNANELRRIVYGAG